MNDPKLLELLTRIAEALERRSPPPPSAPDLGVSESYVWHAESEALDPVRRVNRVAIGLLQGIDRQRDILLDNTRRFADGLPANNALLWGARGMGKSSLVKSVHAEVNRQTPGSLVLVEIHREDIPSLPKLLGLLRPSPSAPSSFATTFPSRRKMEATSR